MNDKDRLTSGAMMTLLVLGTIWGFNMVTIKISNQGLAPVTAAALRSGVASLLLMTWMRIRGIQLFHRREIALWGAWAGLLFGLEFLLLYSGLDRTSASRGIVLHDELRAITQRLDSCERSVMMSSEIPSPKYSCSESLLILVNGSTAMEGLSGKGSGGYSGRPDRSKSSLYHAFLSALGNG